MSSIIDQEHHHRDFRPRIRWLVVFITVAFLALVARLWYLQIIKGDDYFRYAARNSFKAREIKAPRGIIFDARGDRIADVRPSFDVVIRPDLIRRPPRGDENNPPLPDEDIDIRTIAEVLSQYVGVPAQSIKEKYYAARGRARHKAVVIKSDVSRDEIAEIEAHRIDLPGVDIQVGQKRTYPYGELFSHLVGYLGEVQSRELKHFRQLYKDSKGEDYYEMGDFIGKYGVEKEFEPYLKGQDGVYYVQEDASGRVVNAFDQDNADDEEYARTMLAYLSERQRGHIPGNDLVLTVDLELQRFVKEKMADKTGAVVVLEPGSGRILAMVNNPSFDPEIFARGISQRDWDTLREDPRHPLEDKALRGQYPPGSTFKMIPAAAALAEHVITEKTRVFCSGSTKIGGRRFRCHRSGGHGFVDLYKALVYSCDVFFYSIATKLNSERLAEYARAFGMGTPTKLGLNQEKPGLIPTEKWKLRVIKQPWVIGDTVSAAIGQGFVLVTPIQLARMTAAIANGGKVLRPYVVQKIVNCEGRVVKEYGPQVLSELPIPPEVLSTVQKSMRGVVADKHGTAHAVRLKNIKMAGKTGTAQVVRQELKDLRSKVKTAHRDHALFTGYAPFEDPKIVVTVLIEHGGHGGAVAGPIARDIIQQFFETREQRAGDNSSAMRNPHPDKPNNFAQLYVPPSSARLRGRSRTGVALEQSPGPSVGPMSGSSRPAMQGATRHGTQGAGLEEGSRSAPVAPNADSKRPTSTSALSADDNPIMAEALTGEE